MIIEVCVCVYVCVCMCVCVCVCVCVTSVFPLTAFVASLVTWKEYGIATQTTALRCMYICMCRVLRQACVVNVCVGVCVLGVTHWKSIHIHCCVSTTECSQYVYTPSFLPSV